MTTVPTIPVLAAGQRYQVADRRFSIVSVTPGDDFDVFLVLRYQDGSTADISATEFLACQPELIH